MLGYSILVVYVIGYVLETAYLANNLSYSLHGPLEDDWVFAVITALMWPVYLPFRLAHFYFKKKEN